MFIPYLWGWICLFILSSLGPKSSLRGRAPVVGLIGSFGWSPTYKAGVRLLSRLWPEIKNRVPEARLRIVGRSARSRLAGLPNADGPDVEILEDVSDTIPYFRADRRSRLRAGRGSGMKVKVLEALALGVPVVTTAEGVEGLDAIDEVHATIREDDAELVDQTVALLLDPDLRERRRIAGRSLVEATCSPAVVLDRLEAVYDAVSRQKIEIS